MSTFHVTDRRTGAPLEPSFQVASLEEVDQACEQAHEAFLWLRKIPASDRAAFLDEIAVQLEGRRPDIVERYQAETGLPEGRANGELDRTCNQLRMFAGVVREGTWVDARVEYAIPDRKPIPKPDMRSMNRPIGPVAVFGASNFALAFSVAGGDTASALAAGCPVVAKGHPAHPGVSALVSDAILAAAQTTGMPEGVFRLLFDDGIGVGTALVQHPLIRAVGFTGSRQGGLALITLAQSRSVPIPVFAEMSSINPVFVLPGRLQTEPEALAEQVHTSATMGVGQFCTNPGVVILCGVDGADRFLSRLTELMDGTAASCMLTDGIAQAYANGVHRLEAHPATKKLTTGPQASVFVTNAQAFAQEPELKHEVFGPCTLVVQCESVDEAESLLSGFEGQLTATILAAPAEIPASLLESCELIAGRILVNQMPTGLEVCSATVHGGPFPATSDGRSTSVGTRAIERWTRPVCYQNVPTDLLPVELRD